MDARLLACLFAIPLPALAQTLPTSPAGMLPVPGEAAVPFGELFITGFPIPTGAFHKVTQIDASQPATPRTIHALSLRRPTAGLGGSGGTGFVTIRMAHANWALVPSGASVDVETLRTSPWVDVFLRKAVTLPDWSQAAATPPAPFDVRFPLDTPFAFNGQDALVFQLLMEGVAMSVDGTDRSSVVTPVQNYGIGLGCTVRNAEMSVFANWRVYTDPSLGMDFSVGSNPGSGVIGQQAIAALGFAAVNLPIPGVCAPQLSSGEGYVLLRSSGLGTFRTARITLPHNPVLVGQYDLHVQAWAQLSGQPQPFVGSFGTRTGPIPAPRNDGFSAALAASTENGASFQTWVSLSKHQAIFIGIE